MSDHLSVSAPKTLKQRFGAQVGKFNNWYSDRETDRFTLTFDRSVENRVNLHVGSPDEPAVASALYSEKPTDAGDTGWFTNDGKAHKTLHDAAEHMIAIRAEPRGEIEGGDATEVQGRPKFITPTGRMSFAGLNQPEMQELTPRVQVDPRIDTETLRSADFSDFEQRILAHMTDEQRAAFKAGEAVEVNLDGINPSINPCREIIVIGRGRGDDLFRGGDRRSAEIVIDIESRPRRVGMLGQGAGLLAAAAALSLGSGMGTGERRYFPMKNVTPKKPKQRSSYSPCKASVTGQHKGSSDAKKSAHSVKKAQKAAKRARRAKKMEKISG